MRSKLSAKLPLTSLEGLNGEIYETNQQKSIALSNMFASVFKTDPKTDLVPKSAFQPTQCNDIFQPFKIFEYLKNLNSKTSSGSDQIPNFMLKRLAYSLAESLSIIFKFSYYTAQIPNDWRLAIVKPIPKSGTSPKISNFRPISSNSSISIVLERLLKDKLLNYCFENKILSETQFGFYLRDH